MIESKTLEEQIDLENAIIGIPLTEFIMIEEAIIKARESAKRASLAANVEKKQKAIEETYEILETLLSDG